MKRILENKRAVILLAVFCNMLWGSAYPFVKIGYALFHITDSAATKIVFAGLRFCIAGLVLWLLSAYKVKKIPRISKGNKVTVLLVAAIQTTIEYIFFYIGLSNTAASNGSIVNSVSAFFGVILAHFVYKNDRLTTNKIIGCFIGFAGVLAVTIGQGQIHFAWNGEGFIMLAALAFSIGSMLGKKAAQRDDVVTVTAYNLLLGGIALILTGALTGGKLTVISLQGMAVLLYLALLSAAAFSIWTTLLTFYPVGKLSFYNFIIPVSGTILSAIFLKEKVFKWNYAVALLCISIGIYCVTRKPEKKIDKFT